MAYVHIQIPEPKRSFYTLYAEGVSFGFTGNRILILDSNYPIILYYKFRKRNRKLYICITPEKQKINTYTFQGIDKELSVVAQLRGRGFDRFKRSYGYINKLTKSRCTKYPAAFFWQLAYLCSTKSGLNSRYNLNRLVKKYDPDFEMPENIQWK